MGKLNDEISILASSLVANLEDHLPWLRGKLFGDRPPGMEKLPEEKYLEFVRSRWDDPDYRMNLRKAVGATNFLKTYSKAFGVPMEQLVPPKRPASDGLAEKPVILTVQEGAIDG